MPRPSSVEVAEGVVHIKEALKQLDQILKLPFSRARRAEGLLLDARSELLLRKKELEKELGSAITQEE